MNHAHPPSYYVEDHHQAFKKLNEGLASLADNSESFASKTILGLLRSAPDLTPHLKNVTSRFTIDKGRRHDF